MKIKALRNFIANDVNGYPGYILNQEEMDAIAPILALMIKEGLIRVEEGKPADEAPGSSGIIDLGPAKDDLPDSPVDEEEDKPRASSKSKKKKG